MMSLNEEKDPRVLLKTFKRELKGWEHEFASVNKRKPTKRDIANENEIGGVFSDLALKYKAYAKLKAYVEELGDNAGEQGTVEDSFEKLDSVTRPLTIVKSDSSPEEMREETLKSEKAPSRKRFEVGTAPVSKENIGNHQDIFAKRFAEQNVIRSPNIDPSPSPQATVGPASPSSFLNEKRNYLESKPIIQPSLQVYEFNQRKQELEIITSAPRKLDFGPTFVPSSPVLPISSVSPTSYQYADKVITGEAVVASVGIPDAPSPSHANLSPVHSISAQLQCDEPKIIAVGNLDNQNISEGEDKRAVKGPPPPLPARKLSIAPDIQNSITGEESDNVVGMVVEEVDEVSQPAENVVVKTNPPNELGLPVKNLPSLIVTNLFSRIDKSGVLRCKLFRKKTLMGKGPPTYVLHNEVNNSFLLSARKVLISKAANYMIFNHLDDLSKESTHYVAKLKSNFMRTNFTLSDTRNSARIQEIGYVNYSKNVLPRELHVAIEATDLNDNSKNDHTTDIAIDFRNRNHNLLFFLRNKAPRWNEATQSHCLNFGGRVTQPSIKNMQLISDLTGPDYNILQFGRCGADYFTLDVRWPMTVVEAFGIAITTFDAYDSA